MRSSAIMSSYAPRRDDDARLILPTDDRDDCERAPRATAKGPRALPKSAPEIPMGLHRRRHQGEAARANATTAAAASRARRKDKRPGQSTLRLRSAWPAA